MPRFSSTLIEHFESPRNRGRMASPDAMGTAHGMGGAPAVTFYLSVKVGVVDGAQFDATGCGVTIAACSLLTEMLIGKTLIECQGIEVKDLALAMGGLPPDKAYCADIC